MSGKTILLRWAAAVCAVCAVGLPAAGAVPAEMPSAVPSVPTAQPAAQPSFLLPGVHRIFPPYGSDAWKDLISVTGKTAAERIAEAEAVRKTPIPPFPNDLYLDYSTNGNRFRFEQANLKRRARLMTLFLGEMAEGKGRFLPDIARHLDSFCHDPTWMLPAHDGILANFRGRTVGIDLTSSLRGWCIAEITGALGDRLPKATQDLVWETVRQRIYAPYVRGRLPWLRRGTNWNPVCHADVVGAVLTMPNITDAERAAVVRSALKNVRYYLRCFAADGWCKEGLAYWGFGFSRLVFLSESVRRASGGKTDILRQWTQLRDCALTPARCYLTGGLYPALCDTPADARPNILLCAWLNRYFGGVDSGIPVPENGDFVFPDSVLLNLSDLPPPPAAEKKPAPVSVWFPSAQLLIGRSPAHDAAGWMIGGSNGVPHNHNDVGVYGYTMGNVPMAGDLGGEVYTSRTFSSKRYHGCLLNSFGHAVPRPDGHRQTEGSRYHARVLACTPDGDRPTLKLDLRGAYRFRSDNAPTTLERVGTWSVPDAVLTVTDTFAYPKAPAPFETTATTWGSLTRVDERTVRIELEGRVLLLTVEASAPFDITECILAGSGKPTEGFIPFPNPFGLSVPNGPRFANGTARRLGIRLKSPAKKGFIRLIYRPGK